LIRATEKNPLKDLQDDHERRKKHFKSIRILDKHKLHVGTSCQMPLLTKKNIKGQLEYAEMLTCGVLEECFME